jgi:hypothetical protein
MASHLGVIHHYLMVTNRQMAVICRSLSAQGQVWIHRVDVVHAIEIYLALRETAEIKADPHTLRGLAEAREAVRDGDVVYGTEAVRALVKGRLAS